MAYKLLFTFASNYRTDGSGNAQSYEVVHDDTPPYAVRVRKPGQTTVYETSGGFESHAYIGQVFNSTRYDGSAISYQGQGEFPYAAIVTAPLNLTASKTDVTTAGGSDGEVTLSATGGVVPYQYSRNGGSSWQGSNVFSGLAAGTYTFTVKDTQGTVKTVDVQVLQPDGVLLGVECNGYHLQEKLSEGTGGWRWGVVVEYNVAECGYTVVDGCTNPEASNYDPNATVDNGSCILPEKVILDAMPALAVAGNALPAVLHAGATGQAEAAATCRLTIGSPTADTVVVVDGQSFRYSEAPQADGFYNAETLAAAMLDNLVLDSRYVISQPQPSEVLLTARKAGTRHAPEASCTNGGVHITLTAGADQYRSQAKSQWGCYVEVWACAGSYGAAVDKASGTMLERFEKPYAPGNAYRFDLASTLRLLLAHALFSESGRLAAYYVRYGEIYAAEGESGRRRFPVGESAVQWVLDGALPFTETNVLQAPLLLNRCREATVVPLQGGAYAEALYVLAAAGVQLQVSAAFRYFDGATLSETLIDTTPAAGGVHKLSLQPVFARAYTLHQAKALTQATLTLTATLGGVPATLGTQVYQFTVPEAQHRCLVFLTSLSAYEALWLEGYSEPAARRSATLYGKGIPTGATASSRSTGVQQADLRATEKLHTGLLTRASYDALLRELGPSTEVFLYKAGIYTACTLTDLEARADVLAEEYTLSFTLEPGLPLNALTN